MVDAGQPWLHNLITVLSAPTMVLSERDGQLRRAGAQGAIHAHSRVLSQAVLEVNGTEPPALSSGLVSADTAMFASVPRPTATDAADPAAWITRERTVRPGIVRELIRVTGGPRASGTATVTLRVAADLAVLTDIKDGRTGALVPMTVTDSGLEWGDEQLTVRLTAPGAAAAGDDGEAWLTWDVPLTWRSHTEIHWQLTVQDQAALVMAPPEEPARRDLVPRARSGEPRPAPDADPADPAARPARPARGRGYTRSRPTDGCRACWPVRSTTRPRCAWSLRARRATSSWARAPPGT